MNEQKVLFRPEKSTLEESMSRLEVFPTVDDLYNAYKKLNTDFRSPYIKSSIIRNGDSRVGWNNAATLIIEKPGEEPVTLGTYTTDWNYDEVNNYIKTKVEPKYPGNYLKWKYLLLGIRKEYFDFMAKDIPDEDNGYYMCDNCFKIFPKIKTYEDLKPCCGKIFNVERYIVNDIAELNKKGYTTEISCSGHLADYHTHYLWISFDYNKLIKSKINVAEFIESISGYDKIRFSAGHNDNYINSLDGLLEHYNKIKELTPTLISYVLFVVGDIFYTDDERKAIYDQLHKWVHSLKDYKK